MKKTGIICRIAVSLVVVLMLQSFISNPKETELVDLGLILKVDKPNPQVGDRVTVNFTIANSSAQIATGVSLLTEIPACFDLISSISLNGTQRGTQLIWNNLTIKPNNSLHFVYSARVSAKGDYISIAEILSADQADRDSTPGNGADSDKDGIIGSYDQDSTQDMDDEDDGDDVLIVVSDVNEEIEEEVEEESIVEETTTTNKKARFLSTVKVFPNPSSHLLKVDITKDESAPVQIFLFDSAGNLITQKATTENDYTHDQVQLDVSNLSAGSYVVHVKIGNESHVKRVMVVR